MSRSRKKHPFGGCVLAQSEKEYKAKSHRAYRRAVRMALVTERELPHWRRYGDPWTGPKDGKTRWEDEECYRK